MPRQRKVSIELTEQQWNYIFEAMNSEADVDKTAEGIAMAIALAFMQATKRTDAKKQAS